MLILQINTIRDSIRFRKLEWAAAIVTAFMGVILLYPYPTFNGSFWTAMAALASENTWGWGCLTLGSVRVAVLYWNGRWRRCSHARAFLAGLNCFWWASLVYGLSASREWPPGLAFNVVFFFADLLTVYDAAVDARSTDEAFRARDTT